MIGWDDLGAPQLEPLDWKPSVLTIKPLFHFLSLARTGFNSACVFSKYQEQEKLKVIMRKKSKMLNIDRRNIQRW